MPYSKVVSRYPEKWLDMVEQLDSARPEFRLKCDDSTDAKRLMFKMYAFFRALEKEANRPPVGADPTLALRVLHAAQTSRKLRVEYEGEMLRVYDSTKVKTPKQISLDQQLEAQLMEPPDPTGTVAIPMPEKEAETLHNLINRLDSNRK